MGQRELRRGPGLPVLAYSSARFPAQASWLGPAPVPRHGLALNTIPRFTPTIPKAGFAGYGLPHCGYEMS